VRVVEERVDDPAHQRVGALALHGKQGGVLPGQQARALGSAVPLQCSAVQCSAVQASTWVSSRSKCSFSFRAFFMGTLT
jgi:hypothetical protein